MTGFKLATYQASDGPRAGLVIDDKVFEAAKLSGKGAYATVLGILEDWRTAQGALKKAAANAGKSRVKGLPLGRSKLLAPVRWPSAIYCAGANYADHAAEMARRMNRPMEPDPHSQGLKAWHFIKASRALTDPGATVKISGVSDQVDWEVELAAVIGRPAKNERHDAPPRRPDPDRHAGGSWLGTRRISQGRRCGEELDREDRDPDHQNRLIMRF
jgi:2-keto-4-pentenoate hydratase/2-oxohepta-3-ene-1,7-dioic acid hydratase in catechol pathway